MINQIFKKVASGADSVSASVNGGVINGILVCKSIAWHASDFITIIRSGDIHEVIVPRLSLITMSYISDLENGWNADLELALKTLVPANYTQFGMNALYIPIGCIDLGATGTILEVKVEIGNASTVGVSSVLNNRQPDHTIKTIETTLLAGTQDRCTSLYLVKSSAVSAPVSEVLTLQLKTAQGSFMADEMGIFGESMVHGQIEAFGPRRACRVFDGVDMVGERVTWNLTGTTAGYSFIMRTVERTVRRVSLSTIGMVEGMAKRIKEMGPEEERAARRATLIPSKEDLAVTLGVLDEG